MPDGVAKGVVPGRKPLVKLLPPLVDVAKPMSEAPPLKNLPTWKAETRVEPEAKVSGSTSVRCWLVLLVNGSLLSWSRVTLAKARTVDESANTSARVIATRMRIGPLNREIKDIMFPPYSIMRSPDVTWTGIASCFAPGQLRASSVINGHLKVIAVGQAKARGCDVAIAWNIA